MKDIPWQRAARRLLKDDKALVYFSDKRLGDGIWGTAFIFKDYLVIQIRPNIPIKDQIRTLIHEALHHEYDECPRLEKINGKWKITGLRSSWHEPAIYQQESELMRVVEERWSKLRPIRDELFQVAPGLKLRKIASMLDCVY